MQCLLIFFALLAFATFSIRAAAGGESGGLRRRSYHQVARQFTGRYTPGGFFSQSSVRFRYGDTFATLSEAATRGPHPGRCTQLQINWPDSRFRIEIACHASPNDSATFRSLRTMKSGDAEFDRRLVVRGADEEAVRRFLSDGVRWQIIRLFELTDDKHLYIVITHGQLCIQKPGTIRSYTVLKKLIENGLALYDQAMITRAEGIEFIDDNDAAALEHVTCQVCGDEIAGHEMVYCQRCKTPHHDECWQYVGACSVYGCLEKKCRRPQDVFGGPHRDVKAEDRSERTHRE
jgi:Prokaryotic RING finger family 1